MPANQTQCVTRQAVLRGGLAAIGAALLPRGATAQQLASTTAKPEPASVTAPAPASPPLPEGLTIKEAYVESAEELVLDVKTPRFEARLAFFKTPTPDDMAYVLKIQIETDPKASTYTGGIFSLSKRMGKTRHGPEIAKLGRQFTPEQTAAMIKISDEMLLPAAYAMLVRPATPWPVAADPKKSVVGAVVQVHDHASTHDIIRHMDAIAAVTRAPGRMSAATPR